MQQSSATWIDLAREITGGVERILTPREVIQTFRQFEEASSAIDRELLGHDQNGEPIEAYRWGTGRCHVLWYGFPDPGEAVGATGVVALFSALLAGNTALGGLDVTWHAIPCLNLYDQPDDGYTLSPVMKTGAQEVDWCVDAPRPETTALLTYAGRIEPRIVFPLHDEYHCREPLPLYCMVSEALAPTECESVRQAVQAFGYRIDVGTSDPSMGNGFARMSIARDYENSTFSVMARRGLVFVCEVSDLPTLSAHELAAAQLAANLAVLFHRL